MLVLSSFQQGSQVLPAGIFAFLFSNTGKETAGIGCSSIRFEKISNRCLLEKSAKTMGEGEGEIFISED